MRNKKLCDWVSTMKPWGGKSLLSGLTEVRVTLVRRRALEGWKPGAFADDGDCPPCSAHTVCFLCVNSVSYYKPVWSVLLSWHCGWGKTEVQRSLATSPQLCSLEMAEHIDPAWTLATWLQSSFCWPSPYISFHEMLQLEGPLELIWFTGPLPGALGQLGLESSERGPLFGCKITGAPKTSGVK